MAIGKNKLGDQVVPRSEQQKHQHSKDAANKKSSSSKSDKPVKEEAKQSLGYQDSGASRAQQTPD